MTANADYGALTKATVKFRDAHGIPIPSDPEKRAALAKMAGLTDEERHALDLWCYREQMKRQRGVLLYEAEPLPPNDGSRP